MFTRLARTLTLLLPFVSQRASLGLPGIVMTTVCTHRHSRRLKTMQRKRAKLTSNTCSSEIKKVYKLEQNNAINYDKNAKGKEQVYPSLKETERNVLAGNTHVPSFPPCFPPFSFPCCVAALLPSATCSTWSYMCIVDISEICVFSKRCELRSTRETRVEELSPPRLPAPLSVRLGPRMLCSASSGLAPR